LDGQAVTPRSPGRLRIIAGAKRGRYLRVARTDEVRPTSEKVREAIFDVLGPIDGMVVLDLFAGTGALGLEALSRGAMSCVFVEEAVVVAEVLRANIATLSYQPVCDVIVRDFREALARLIERDSVFDLLFVDPPYRMLPEVEIVLGPLLPSLVSDRGVVVAEGDRSTRVSFGFPPVFDRVYGATRVTMISNKGSTR
jgi:16S rRNA (guanine966-N2)-methyltransferase